MWGAGETAGLGDLLWHDGEVRPAEFADIRRVPDVAHVAPSLGIVNSRQAVCA